MAKLVSGPTTVISSSARGERGSPRMWATPPKMNRVMPATATPFARPTSACDSSWARIDSTNSTAAVAAMPQPSQRRPFGVPGGKQTTAQVHHDQRKNDEQAPVEAHLDPENPPHPEAARRGDHLLRIWRWFVPHAAAAASAAQPAGPVKHGGRSRPTSRPHTWTLEGCETHPFRRGSCAAAGRWCLVVRPHGGRRLRRLGRAGRSGRYRRLRGRGQRRWRGHRRARACPADRAAPGRRAPQERAAFPERAARRARGGASARPASTGAAGVSARRGLPARRADAAARRGGAAGGGGGGGLRRRGGPRRRRRGRGGGSRLRWRRGSGRPRRRRGNGRHARLPPSSCSRPTSASTTTPATARQTEVALATGPRRPRDRRLDGRALDPRVRVLVLDQRRRQLEPKRFHPQRHRHVRRRSRGGDRQRRHDVRGLPGVPQRRHHREHPDDDLDGQRRRPGRRSGPSAARPTSPGRAAASPRGRCSCRGWATRGASSARWIAA